MKPIGVDEAGRGPWAGPVVAAAVKFASISDDVASSLKDSKLLSATKRASAFDSLRRSDSLIGIGWVSAGAIDELGISQAVKQAMHTAVAQIAKQDEFIIIDGNVNYLSEYYDSVAIIKADKEILEVSAASIVAKVMRDRYMNLMARLWPNYGFDRHFGYGTGLHSQRLEMHGLSPIHRRSFRPMREMDYVN